MAEVKNGPEVIDPPKTASEKAAQARIKDILDEKNIGIHFTKISSIGRILEEGILSPDEAKKRGKAVHSQWTKSHPDMVYFYDVKEDPEANKMFLEIYGRGLPGEEKPVAVFFRKDGLQDEPAQPIFPDPSTEKLQRMIKGGIERDHILGLGIQQNLDNAVPEDSINVEKIVTQITHVGEQNPQNAVPLYNQNGDCSWPIGQTRTMILKEAV